MKIYWILVLYTSVVGTISQNVGGLGKWIRRGQMIYNRTQFQPPVSSTKSLCGHETELRLSGSGSGSSLTLSLEPPVGRSTDTCKLRITAPESHIVHVNIPDEEELSDNLDKGNFRSCMLSVYLPENRRTAVWRTDPCSSGILPDGGLLTHHLRIIWNYPFNRTQVKRRNLVITAIGQGDFCKSEGLHTCMKVGWNPIMCISDNLICDGVQHCPKSAGMSDEDQELCRDRKGISSKNWEQIAAEFLKKFTGHSRAGNLLPALETNERASWLYGKELGLSTTERNKDGGQQQDLQAKNIDSLSSALSHYGPWGYLMIGMLICGTILMLCGLWECCCRGRKYSSSPIISTNNSTQSQPTTVLIFSSGSPGDENQSPPTYEELDQPPSYNVLFPAKNNVHVIEGDTRQSNG